MSKRENHILVGSPLERVLSPFLFTLYTSDFQYKSESCHLQKYSDEPAVVGCIRDGQEAEYRALVERVVAWCGNNHLTLNVNKTKEMILDFRRNRVESNTVSFMGEEVEVVEEYKYLGVHLDNRLDWRKNSKAVYKKGHSRLHFLRTLRFFNVCCKMLQIFYKSVVESVISSAIVCWGSSIRSRDLKRLNSLIKKAGSVLGTTVEPLEEIMQRRILQRIKKRMDNPEHSLHKTVRQRKSVFSQRLLQFGCNTDRYWRTSFLPTAIVI
nr:sorting nexin-22 isoform X1 [Nothobranchius furzeri]